MMPCGVSWHERQRLKRNSKNDKRTAAQVEALGRELGMSPEAVRQALQEKAGIASTPQTQTANQTLLSSITRQGIKTCAQIAAIYNAITLVLIVMANAVNAVDSPAPIALPVITIALSYMLVGPVVVPFRYGWNRKDWRQGLLMGAVLTLLSILTIGGAVAGAKVSHRFDYPQLAFDNSLFAAIAVMAVLSGMIGGAMGKAWQERKVALER
jgi:hypothetical protein